MPDIFSGLAKVDFRSLSCSFSSKCRSNGMILIRPDSNNVRWKPTIKIILSRIIDAAFKKLPRAYTTLLPNPRATCSITDEYAFTIKLIKRKYLYLLLINGDKDRLNDREYYHGLKSYVDSVVYPDFPYSHVYAIKEVVEKIPSDSVLHLSINDSIVHIHGNSANMAIELLAVTFGGVKVKITHSHNTATMHPCMHKMLWPLFAKLCTVRLACGEDAGKWLYREQKFTVLNNGIETNKYLFSDSVRSITRKELGVKENEILLGHIGNFIEQKNHTFLIDIFSEVHRANPEFKLLLISDGMLMPTIKDKVHSLELDDAVVFLGKTMNVQNYLSAMDLFLLPSLHVNQENY